MTDTLILYIISEPGQSLLQRAGRRGDSKVEERNKKHDANGRTVIRSKRTARCATRVCGTVFHSTDQKRKKQTHTQTHWQLCGNAGTLVFFRWSNEYFPLLHIFQLKAHICFLRITHGGRMEKGRVCGVWGEKQPNFLLIFSPVYYRLLNLHE